MTRRRLVLVVLLLAITVGVCVWHLRAIASVPAQRHDGDAFLATPR